MPEGQAYYEFLDDEWEWRNAGYNELPGLLHNEFPELTGREARAIVRLWWQAKKELGEV